MSSADSIIDLCGLRKSYRMGTRNIDVLQGIDLDVKRGDFIAIMGPSGSGKTTLLNVLGCLDTFDAGDYTLLGQPVHSLNPDELAQLRCEGVGFVFQNFYLLPRISAQRNVELPMIYHRGNNKDRPQRALDALARVGLSDRVDHLPTELSGGQQQRVAIARALANKPSILIADEPTGSLDTATGEDIMSIFKSLNAQGMTIVMVTHENDIAAFADRQIHLRDGRIESDTAGVLH